MSPTTEARAAYHSVTPEVTPRDRLWWLLTVISAVVILLGAGGFFAYNSLRNTQVNGVERGYKNRAASCALLAAQTADVNRLSEPLPDICLEAEVVRYYEPNR
jgi:hypothetical protein